MDVIPISASLGTATAPQGPVDRNAPIRPEDIKKVADQFEAIIVRQRLKPAIEPIMGGGDSAQGGAIAGGGGGVYGYLLTDVLAGKLSEGTGMGLSHMIETQLTPAAMKEAYAQAVKAEAEKPQSPISHHE